MEKMFWSSVDIRKLFRLDERIKSRQTLLNAEERGEIPKASRVPRGNIQVRQWNLAQLPAIGEKFGFLGKPNSQIIACIYTPKGGVLKSTTGFNFGRTLALNGIKTLVIDLDVIQGSISGYALPRQQIESLDELDSEYLGLYHFFCENASLKEVIQPTSLPTLDVIPQTTELNILEKKLRLESRREYAFIDKLINKLDKYDVIIFDNGPSWNQLVESSLTASKVIISPMGCDIETFKALDKNLSAIFEFQEAMKIKWNHFIQLPTLLEKNKLSQQIYGAYLSKYADSVIPIPIRRSITGQEARAFNQCVIEHDPASPLAQDYYDVIKEVWSRITNNGS